jgi:enoyl-CoA hydratase
MSEQYVQYKVEDSVAIIHMDDGKANALGPQMIEALREAFNRANTEANAVVLVGREGKFCAGFDLKIMTSGIEAAHKLVANGADLYLQIYGFAKPVVVACTGHAMAGGALMLLVGDTRIGTKGPFKVGLNEVSIGMPLPILGQELARDRLAPQHLVAACVQATIYSPEEAVEVGYLDKVEAGEDLVASALAEAKRLGKLPGGAYGHTKRVMRQRTIDYIRETLASDLPGQPT